VAVGSPLARTAPQTNTRAGLLRPARSPMSPALTPWLFLLPAVAIYAFVVIYPTIYTGWLSLHVWDGISPRIRYVGLQNFVDLFTIDRVFWIAVKNTSLWAVGGVAIPMSLGLALALALNRPFRGFKAFRALFYLPAILSLSLTGLVWSWIYHPTLGLLNQALTSVGLDSWTHAWLAEPRIALYPMMIAAAWHNAGLPMVLYLAGLQTVPQDAVEAARLDGASRFQVFRYMTLPLLRETHLVVFAIMMINSLKVYDIIYVMTYGGPANQTQVLSTWMYFQTFNFNKVGMGTAIAVLLLAFTVIFAAPYVRYMSRKP
jgi:raffinose/stachyose/melibiose transport system permease protein